MSDLRRIEKLLNNYDRIEKLLDAIGCEYISSEQRGELVTAQLPERFNSRNKRSTQVRLNESLSCQIRNRADFKGGSIFDLISYIHFDIRGDLTSNLYESKKFICELFGWNEFINGYSNSNPEKDYTASLKAILKNKKRKKEIKPNPVLPEETMNEFYFYDKPLPWQKWIDEGISYRTQVMYGVGFDLDSKRVVFPLRNRFGQLVGVKGRIMKDEDDEETKYLYLYRCNNRYEWFNFYNAHPYILINKKVYIFESEKSCMKAFDFGLYHTLAIGASDITDEQAEIVKRLGLDVEIFLCYDKGKTFDEIMEQAEVFEGRKVNIVFDSDNTLKDKDAPIDNGVEVWNHMINNNVYEDVLNNNYNIS